ncbi:MAG: hypothetical protein ACRDN9_08410 [Streptosporangiaceae bacterium]
MSSQSSFEPLPGAEGGPSTAIRYGDTVRRPAGPWTPTVHALLRHLEHVGFQGCPRVVGDGYDDQGREVLTYVDGEIRHPHAWNDEGAWQVGRMLRAPHGATASFRTAPRRASARRPTRSGTRGRFAAPPLTRSSATATPDRGTQ